MLSEAIYTLKELALEGRSLNKLEPSREADRYFDRKSGEVLDVPKAIPARGTIVLTLASLVAACERYAHAINDENVLWVSPSQVVLVTNDHGMRDDKVTLPLKRSPIFDTLLKLATDKPKSQKELLAVLRHDLNAAEIHPTEFELSITALVWNTNATTDANIGTVRSTMGTQINSEVRGASPIAAEISVTFAPYPAMASDIHERMTVRCSVLPSAEDQTISVRPLPGELDAATNDGMEAVAKWLSEEQMVAVKVPVFCGTP